MVGLIAASMSSIDSALNSLSAVTVEDFIRPRLSKQTSAAKQLLLGRACTMLWGLFAVVCAFQVENIAPTVLEAVNKVGSMVNGPLLALIASAILMQRVSQTSALVGFVGGLLANLLVAVYLPEVSWLWWNVIGFIVAFLCIVLGSAFLVPSPQSELSPQQSFQSSAKAPKGYLKILLSQFLVILGVCMAVQW
jgi:SSS family solute:Na+ symporter